MPGLGTLPEYICIILGSLTNKVYYQTNQLEQFAKFV